MSTRRLNNIRMLAEAIENLYESENQLTDFEESPTNIKYIISDEGKKLLIREQYNENKYSQNICPILNEVFSENHEIIELPCKHIFDHDSILFWLENQKSECPVCRFKLPSKEQSYFNNYSNPNQRDPEQRHISNSGSLLEEEKDDETSYLNERENLNMDYQITEPNSETSFVSDSTRLAINLSYHNDIEILRNAYNSSVMELNNNIN